MAIYFYKQFGPLGYLATYSEHGFYKDGVYWKTSEHYYQAQKFDDDKVREMIINADTPKIASNIGRDKQFRLREDWEEVKQDIMYDAVYYKFKAHQDICKKLLDTFNGMSGQSITPFKSIKNSGITSFILSAINT